MRKTFNHSLVPRIELTTQTIAGQRWYLLPNGLTKLKSVTTILSEKTDKTALLEWRKRVGEAEANRITSIATRRGNTIHSIVERYLLNEEKHYLPNEMPVNIDSFLPIKKELDNHVDNILGIELPLYSKALGCAGRTDLVAEFDGITSVVDFKTSKKLKKTEWIENYFIQSTIYSMMFERLYGIKTPQIVIMITVDDETEAQLFVENRAKYVNRAIEILT